MNCQKLERAVKCQLNSIEKINLFPIVKVWITSVDRKTNASEADKKFWKKIPSKPNTEVKIGKFPIPKQLYEFRNTEKMFDSFRDSEKKKVHFRDSEIPCAPY